MRPKGLVVSMQHYVEFPNLGWKIPISPDLISIGPVTIKWYGVIIAVGFLLAMIYALKRVKEFDLNPDRMIDVVLVSALFAFVGARLYYVVFSEDRAQFFSDPITILQVWNGGLAIYGGVIFAFLTALWMCRVRKVNTLAMFDIASLGFLIGQSIGRWGNFVNQEAFGGNTNLPWAMTGDIIKQGVVGGGYDPDLPVHPTFLYESLWCLVGLVLLHVVSKKAYRFKGQIFAMYIGWYGLGRFWIEGLRTDSLMLGTMRISQVVAVLAVLGGIALFFIFKNVAAQSPKDLFEESLELAEEAAEEAARETEEGAQDAEAGGEPAETAGEDAPQAAGEDEAVTEEPAPDGTEETPAQETAPDGESDTDKQV